MIATSGVNLHIFTRHIQTSTELLLNGHAICFKSEFFIAIEKKNLKLIYSFNY